MALTFEGELLESAQIVLARSAHSRSMPRAADEFLTGKRFDDAAVATAADLAAKPAKPLDDADLSYVWRKKMVRVVVEDALRRVASRAGLPQSPP